MQTFHICKASQMCWAHPIILGQIVLQILQSSRHLVHVALSHAPKLQATVSKWLEVVLQPLHCRGDVVNLCVSVHWRHAQVLKI